MKQYKLEKRYEWRSLNGKVWTKWYTFDAGPYTEEEANKIRKEKLTDLKDLIKRTKLEHEIRIVEITD